MKGHSLQHLKWMQKGEVLSVCLSACLNFTNTEKISMKFCTGNCCKIYENSLYSYRSNTNWNYPKRTPNLSTFWNTELCTVIYTCHKNSDFVEIYEFLRHPVTLLIFNEIKGEECASILIRVRYWPRGITIWFPARPLITVFPKSSTAVLAPT